MPKRGEPNGRGRKGGGHQPPELTVAFKQIKEILEKTPPLPPIDVSSIPEPASVTKPTPLPTLPEASQKPEDAPDEGLIYSRAKTYHKWETGADGKKHEVEFPIGEIIINQHEPIVVLSDQIPPDMPPEKLRDWRFQQYVFRGDSGRPQWKRGQTISVQEFQQHQRTSEGFDPLFLLGTTFEGTVEAEGRDQQKFPTPVIVQYVGIPPRGDAGRPAPFSGDCTVVGHLRCVTYPKGAPSQERYALYTVNADWQTQLRAGLEETQKRITSVQEWVRYLDALRERTAGKLQQFFEAGTQNKKAGKELYAQWMTVVNTFYPAVKHIEAQYTQMDQSLQSSAELPRPELLVDTYGDLKRNIRTVFVSIDALRRWLSFIHPDEIPPPPAHPASPDSADLGENVYIEDAVTQAHGMQQELAALLTEIQGRGKPEKRIKELATNAQQWLTYLDLLLAPDSKFLELVVVAIDPDQENFDPHFVELYGALLRNLPGIQRSITDVQDALYPAQNGDAGLRRVFLDESTTESQKIYDVLKQHQKDFAKMFLFLHHSPAALEELRRTDSLAALSVQAFVRKLEPFVEDEAFLEQMDLYLERPYEAPDPSLAFIQQLKAFTALIPEMQEVNALLSQAAQLAVTSGAEQASAPNALPPVEQQPIAEPFTEAWLATLDPHHRDSWRSASAAHPEISLSDIPNNLEFANTGERLTIQVHPTDANLHIVHFGDDPREARHNYSTLFRGIEIGDVVKRGSVPRREAARPAPPRSPEPPRSEPPRRPEPFTAGWLQTYDDETQEIWRDVEKIHRTLKLNDLPNGLRNAQTFDDVVITTHPTLARRFLVVSRNDEYLMNVRDIFHSILHGKLEPRSTSVPTRGRTTSPAVPPPSPPSAPRRRPLPPHGGTGASTADEGFRPPRVEPFVHRSLTGWRRYLPSLHELTTGWSQSGHLELERDHWRTSLQNSLRHPFDLLAFSSRGRENNRKTRLKKEIDRREEILNAPLEALMRTWHECTKRYSEDGQQRLLYALQDPVIRQVFNHIDTLDRSEKFAYRNVTDTEKTKQMQTGPEQYEKQVLAEIHLLPDQREQIAQLIELEAELQRLNAVLTEIMTLERSGGLQALIDARLIDEAREAEFSDVEHIAISAENNAVDALKSVEREWSALPDDDARRTQALASIKDPFLHRIILGDQTAMYRRGDRTYTARGTQPERFVVAHERQGPAMLPQNRKYVRGPLKNATPFANYVEGVRRGIALQPLENRTKLWDETTKYLQRLEQEMATARREYQQPGFIDQRIIQLETRAAERITSVKALWEAISTDPASRLAIVKEHVDWPGVEEIVEGVFQFITTHSGDYDWDSYLPTIYKALDSSNFRGELREVRMQKLNEHIAVLERKLTEALQKSTDALIGRDAGTDADEGEERWTKKRKKKRR